MNLFETIITAILASGAWLLIVVFLGKSLIANWFSKDIEKYKGQISAQNSEKKIILSRVNEKRAEAIAEIYQGIIKYTAKAKKFVHQAEHVDEEERENLLNSLSESANQFREIYSKNHLYLTKTTCSRIQDVFKEVQIPAHNFIFALGAYLHSGGVTKEQYVTEWGTAFTSFADKIPTLLEDLENQFRSLLGVED
jgi:hypothetical protein